MENSGFSTARLERMRAVMRGYVERGEVPGVVALVWRRGEAHVAVQGSLARGEAPVRRDSIFRISSMTKPVTAVAALILVEECRLRLDDPVDGLLSELANRQVLRRWDGPLDNTVPAHRPITVRDLLTFQMGFGQPFAELDAAPILREASALAVGMGPPAPGATPAPDEWLRRLGTLPLMHQPGAGWRYNTGSDVLGVLIARAAGQPLDEFLEERLFAPLGMKDTGFSVPPDKRDRLATSYWTSFTTGNVEVYDEADGGAWCSPPAFPSGAGGLVSTVDDYLAFARMLLDGGRYAGGRILSRPSIELMTSDHLPAEMRNDGEHVTGFLQQRGWGMGMAVTTRRHDIAGGAGAYGWDGGLGTSWQNDPRERLIGILMTQQAWSSPSPPTVSRDFWTTAYQAIDD